MISTGGIQEEHFRMTVGYKNLFRDFCENKETGSSFSPFFFSMRIYKIFSSHDSSQSREPASTSPNTAASGGWNAEGVSLAPG